MRVITSYGVGAFLFLGISSGNVFASTQSGLSIEDVYVARCSAGQKSELCDALAKQLVGRSATVQTSQSPVVPKLVAQTPALGAVAPKSALTEDELRRRWGIYAKLVGKTYYTAHLGTETLSEYSWLVPGEVLRTKSWGRGASAKFLPGGMTSDIRLDPATGKLAGLQPDGSLIGTSSPTTRVRVFEEADGSLVSVIEELKGGQWKLFDKKYGVFRSVEYTPALEASLVAREEAKARPKPDGPSTFGAIVRGLAMGVSGVDAPLMNADGSEVNTLDVLNAAGAELARKNAEGQRQLDESIARAQAEGARQQAEAADARRQAESENARKNSEARSQADDTAASAKATQDRVEHEAAEAERARLAEAARQKAQADKALKDAEALAARHKAEADAKQRLEQQKRQDEASLVASFSGRASTCAGGGSGVLYLQTSRPPKSGCNVRFEARCPGTQPGNGVSFGQNNYIGGSCMGIGDAIQIGQMSCPADQVQVQMTGAVCS